MAVDPTPAVPRSVPRLLTGHAPRRRRDGGIQLGTDPLGGVVLDGLTPDDLAVLARIDGVSTHEDLTAHPRRAGAVSPRAERLLGVLAAAGLVTGPVPTSPSGTHVVLVDGRGAVARGLAGQLADIGVGWVRAGPYAVDAADASGARPDLVLLVGQDPIAPCRARPLRARGIRHLVVSLAETTATIGPLVTPGLSPCVECLDRSRADRDPAWPATLATPTVGPPETVACDPALAALVTGIAAAVAVAALDGQCPGGVTLEVGLPWPRVVQRQWPVHPGCGCGVAGGSASDVGRQWTA